MGETRTTTETLAGLLFEDGDVRDAWTIARTELRTQIRGLREDTRRGLSVVLMLLVFGVVFPATFLGSAIDFGSALTRGPLPLGTAGFAFWLVVLIAGYVGSAAGFNQDRVGTVGSLVRTSVSPTAVSLGRLLDRSLETLTVVVPAALVLLAGVVVGGGPTTAGLVGVAAVPLLVAGFLLGRISGDLIRYANERLQISIWIKAVLALVLLTVVFFGTQVLLNSQYEPTRSAGSALAGPIVPGAPLHAYASVFFAPLGGQITILGVAVVGVVVAAIPLGLVATMALETRMLVRDLGSDAADRVTESHGVPSLFEVVPSARMAWRSLLRTRRDPRTLAHLTPLLFGVLPMTASAFENPELVLEMGPAAALVLGAIAAGVSYCLNPLGDDRDQLPLLLTSTPSVAVLLRGRMLAGTILGLVVAVVIGTPLALLAHGPAYALGQTLLAVFLVVASTGIAVGLGAVVPKFEQREYMSVERAHPSQMALMAFFFGGLVVGGIGVVLLLVTLSGEQLPAVALGWLVYAVVLGLAAGGGYRYAVSRMDAFTLDDV